MPSIRRIGKRHRREWNDTHFRLLRSGIGFFSDGWTDLAHWPLHDRDNWPGEDALEEMRECWEEHGEHIKATRDRSLSLGQPTFGELVFEQGVAPREAYERTRPGYGTATARGGDHA